MRTLFVVATLLLTGCASHTRVFLPMGGSHSVQTQVDNAYDLALTVRASGTNATLAGIEVRVTGSDRIFRTNANGVVLLPTPRNAGTVDAITTVWARATRYDDPIPRTELHHIKLGHGRTERTVLVDVRPYR